MKKVAVEKEELWSELAEAQTRDKFIEKTNLFQRRTKSDLFTEAI